MSRLLALMALVLVPLLASAHQGHHAPSQADAPPPASAEANGTVFAIAAAPSRCPGGGHEDCCCHDGWCTSGSHAHAIADAPAPEVARVAVQAIVAFAANPALRSAALLRFPTRGPPALS